MRSVALSSIILVTLLILSEFVQAAPDWDSICADEVPGSKATYDSSGNYAGCSSPDDSKHDDKTQNHGSEEHDNSTKDKTTKPTKSRDPLYDTPLDCPAAAAQAIIVDKPPEMLRNVFRTAREFDNAQVRITGGILGIAFWLQAQFLTGPTGHGIMF
ncbi:hypothetical protein BJY01DRAFT_248376 [Aspergillus pseudoustus]|uniref:Uncharacterized protein n=1 Tax=Aspergillus pseudoustus TaxID=1810923 RepID=A0ABR4JYB4_9EURO